PSWTCGRRAKTSTRRASLDSPVTRPSAAGMYPMCASPWKGRRWCSQTEYTGMSRTMTSSSCSISKVRARMTSGDCPSPAYISAAARATRPGVSSRPSRSGSSPMAKRNSRTAASARSRSTLGWSAGGCPPLSVPTGVDLLALGHLANLGRGALRGGPSACPGRLVDLLLDAWVALLDAGAGRSTRAVGGATVGPRAVERPLLGGGEHRGPVGVDTQVAGEPRRALRTLADVGEDLGELGRVEGLVLQQVQDEPVEDVAVVVDDVPCLLGGAVR